MLGTSLLEVGFEGFEFGESLRGFAGGRVFAAEDFADGVAGESSHLCDHADGVSLSFEVMNVEHAINSDHGAAPEWVRAASGES